MKILIDTNVILDVLCARAGFVEASSAVWKLCEVNRAEGYISALSVPNIVYILRKELTPQRTGQIVEQITMIFGVIDLKGADLKAAADMNVGDYEDALQMCQAKRIKADYIVTRNTGDYKDSKVPAVTPAELLEKIREKTL
ncbi:MAG: PIN domain-containing protein [Clostridia bacterium]|nr:PIN domain-containing protein [Clostridia bacterium]